MKMSYRVCDICEENIVERVGGLKIKMLTCTGWEKLDICPECKDLLFKFVRENKNEDRTD